MMDSESTTAMEAEAPRPLSGAWLEDNPRAATLLTFVAGLLLGWWVLGWWLFPVSWSEAQPYHLRQDLRADWVQLVANDYQGNGQLDKAAERLASMDAATLITEFEALQADEARTANEHANVRQLAQNLGIQYDLLPISPMYEAFEAALKPHFWGQPFNVTEENIQARIRGALLMAMSNKYGNILLNTTNKSEMAVGYGTLYGDMCGGISVLGDVYKTEVYELARYLNRDGELIPLSSIEKPPSSL